MTRRPRFEPHHAPGEQRAVDEHLRALEGERPDSRRAQLGTAATTREPRAVDLTIVRNESYEGAAFALERLGPRGGAGRRVDSVGQLLEPCRRLRLPQERRDPLD